MSGSSGTSAAQANRESSTSFGSRLLAVVVDLSEEYYTSLKSEKPSDRLTVQQCLNSIVTFCNSYLLLSHENRVAVCVAHQAGSHLVYPAPMQEQLPADSPELLTGKYEPLVHMNCSLHSELQRVMQKQLTNPPTAISTSSLLSGALSKCLCYFQRCVREAPIGRNMSCRIVVVNSSEDNGSQYVSTMNCIFAAQKSSVLIDSCVLWHESGFLQQASDITGGVYIRVPEPASLLQFLLWGFLPGVSTRELLALPAALEIDYRASCCCHHKLVDVGFVCSVCLSIFCQSAPICSRCQTHFRMTQVLSRPKTEKSDRIKKNNKSHRSRNTSPITMET